MIPCLSLFAGLLISNLCFLNAKNDPIPSRSEKTRSQVQSEKLLNPLWHFKTSGRIVSAPAISTDKVFIGSEDGSMYAINKLSGKKIWKFKTAYPITTTPAINQDIVYFGNNNGSYYAVNATNGKQIWKFKTNGERQIGAKGLWGMLPGNLYMVDQYDYFLSSPTFALNTIYFGSSDSCLYALDAETGGLKWKFKTAGPIRSTPTIYNDVIYFGSWDTYVYALDAQTGSELWKFKTKSDPKHGLLQGIQASVVASNGSVFLGARDGYFYALDAITGVPKWKYNAKGSWILTTAAVQDKTIFITTSDSYLFIAVDIETGLEQYQIQTHGYNYSSPSVSENKAFFGDFSGMLYAVDTKSGTIEDQFETPNRSRLKNKILDKTGNLNFLYASKGKEPSLYQTSTDVLNEFFKLGPFLSAPIISNQTLYVGNANGTLYTFKIKN